MLVLTLLHIKVIPPTMFGSKRARNIALACLCIFLSRMANGPATSVQNVALDESTEINLNVGYYVEIVKYGLAIIAGLFFYPVYRTLGIKLTALLTVLLYGAQFVVMIWVVNEWLIYIGYILAGIGNGCLWILWPMVVTDNSTPSKSQRNMAWWWVTGSMGPLIGSLINYFYFLNVTSISIANRQMVYGICTAINLLAAVVAVVFLTDGKKSNVELEDLGEVGEGKGTYEALQEEKEGPSAREWFERMAKRRSFWILLIPLLYWGAIWGYFMKIFPTALASISDERKLIPLAFLVLSAGMVIGSMTWDKVARLTNNTFCIITATIMLLTAIILSILIFPKSAATEILEVGTTETYIKPHNAYVIVISVLMGLADSCVSIIYYTVAGRIYKDGTSLGFSVNNAGFSIFYIIALFAPSLFDLHTYCYLVAGLVLLMCLAITVGLRKYL